MMHMHVQSKHTIMTNDATIDSTRVHYNNTGVVPGVAPDVPCHTTLTSEAISVMYVIQMFVLETYTNKSTA